MTPYRDEHRWKCLDCGWVGTEEMKLRALNPFDKTQEILGCPQCKEIENFSLICQAQGCTRSQGDGALESGRGWSCMHEGRYLWTCWEHSPDNPKNQGKEE